jgi:MSHA biogenesis protein MshL
MLALSGLLLGACTAQQERRVGTYDKINSELDVAATSKTNRQAQSDAVGRAMVPPLQLDQPEQSKTEQRFNLAVSNAPITQVLTALVTGTQYSMLFPPEVSGSVSLNLKNVTIREALDTLREIYGYEYRIQGTRIFVQPNTIQTKLYKINYLANRRQGSSDMRVTGSSPSTVNPTAGGGVPTTQPVNNAGGATNPNQQGATSARIQTSSDFNFWLDLKNNLEAIIGSDGDAVKGDGSRVVINQSSGVVLVKALPSMLRTVDTFLKAAQLVVERQVMLEAKIIEVRLSDTYQTGINWSKFGGLTNKFAVAVAAPGAVLGATTVAGTAAVGNTAGITSALGGSVGAGSTAVLAPTGAGTLGVGGGRGFFGVAFQSANFGAVMSFLEGQGDVQVLSSPRIATTNNQKAVLKVGTDDYFVTGISGSGTSTSNNSGSSNTVSPSIPNITLQPFFSGIALDVTPQIDDEGNIVLHVHPSVSLVEEKTKTVDLGEFGKFTLPLASSTVSETDSIVRVKDGNIVAIGGLMKQTQISDRVGLPGLSGLPMVGVLFGERAGLSNKSELVILMRSTVIDNESSWKENLSESQERIQALDPRGRSAGWQ